MIHLPSQLEKMSEKPGRGCLIMFSKKTTDISFHLELKKWVTDLIKVECFGGETDQIQRYRSNSEIPRINKAF